MTKSGSILIVEDEKDLREVYEIILRHEGYDVRVSSNGKEGVEQVEASTPDLVLLDIFMPVMDGKGFLQNVRLDDHPGMRVVVCSNTSDNSLMSEMIELGADKVVTKADLGPTDIATLVEAYVA